MVSYRFQRVVPVVLLALGSVAAVLPLLGVLLLALQTPSIAGARIDLGDAFHVENFALAWEQGGFAGSLPTSTAIALLVLVIALPASIGAAYGLVVLKAPGRTAITVLLVMGIFLPVEAYVVPLFFDLRLVGLDGTLFGVVLAEVAINISFGAFWMRSFFVDAPTALIEAARLDGAGPLTILVRILLPIARPHILALAVLMFIWTWNDLLAPLVLLSSSGLRTVPMSLSSFAGQNATNYVLMAAAAVIAIVPVVIVYLVLQRSFVRGILDGGVK